MHIRSLAYVWVCQSVSLYFNYITWKFIIYYFYLAARTTLVTHLLLLVNMNAILLRCHIIIFHLFLHIFILKDDENIYNVQAVKAQTLHIFLQQFLYFGVCVCVCIVRLKRGTLWLFIVHFIEFPEQQTLYYRQRFYASYSFSSHVHFIEDNNTCQLIDIVLGVSVCVWSVVVYRARSAHTISTTYAAAAAAAVGTVVGAYLVCHLCVNTLIQ